MVRYGLGCELGAGWEKAAEVNKTANKTREVISAFDHIPLVSR